MCVQACILSPLHCYLIIEQQQFYKSTVVAHPNMLHVPIHRQNSLSNDEDQLPLDFTLYPRSYDYFLVIVSHVHPRFVICNTGMKLLGPTIWPDRDDAGDLTKFKTSGRHGAR